jgi:hypothetical protein
MSKKKQKKKARITNRQAKIKDRGQIFYFDISFFIHIYLSNLKI